MRLLYSFVAVTGFASAVLAAEKPAGGAVDSQAYVVALTEAFDVATTPFENVQIQDSNGLEMANECIEKTFKTNLIKGILETDYPFLKEWVPLYEEFTKHCTANLLESCTEKPKDVTATSLVFKKNQKFYSLCENITKTSGMKNTSVFDKYRKDFVPKYMKFLVKEFREDKLDEISFSIPDDEGELKKLMDDIQVRLDYLEDPKKFQCLEALEAHRKGGIKSGDEKINDLMDSVLGAMDMLITAFTLDRNWGMNSQAFLLVDKRLQVLSAVLTPLASASAEGDKTKDPYTLAVKNLKEFIPALIKAVNACKTVKELEDLKVPAYSEFSVPGNDKDYKDKYATVSKYGSSSIFGFFSTATGKIVGILALAVIAGGAFFAFSGDEEVIEVESQEKVPDAPLPKKEEEKPKAKSTKPGAKKANKGKGALKKKGVKPKTA